MTVASCRLPHCPVAKTGVCLEGIEQSSSCPNYLVASEGEPQQVASAAGDAEPLPPLVETTPLPIAVAMKPEATYEITRSSFARIIICAGEQRSGKTTLLASLYDAFQQGPIGSLSFAGSRTLHGYERRVHHSRIASGGDRPDTDRTKPREGFQFLHLRLRDSTTNERTDLLFGDMSGELYKTLRDSTAECRKHQFIGAAHEFVVLVDGRKIEQGEHAEAFGHVAGLVRALLDAQVLTKRSRVRVLTTKWDLLELQGRNDERRRVEDFERHFRETFGARVATITCARSAARPETGDPTGLESLLIDWVGLSDLLIRPDTPLPPVPAGRAFDTYSAARRRESPWEAAW